ncbi:MAG: histidinol dehydrogenase [Planctomycetes bacterium]|nr:histidinol dehydrogenase [Planctomycetota bacterium]
MPTLRIVQFGSPESREPLRHIRERFYRQISEVSAASVEKTIRVFGRALTPVESVRRIVEAVRARGDDALVDTSRKLDGVKLSPGQWRVAEAELEAAVTATEPALVRTLQEAASNIRRFQQHVRLAQPPMLDLGDRRMGIVYRPLESVGIYIPGGAAAYPSTVLMAAIPAVVAGVKRVVMVSPPMSDGGLLPSVLAAAWISGLREVYRLGGPHAVAALALGTKTIPKVDKIVGPGNVFVMLAKREILGEAGIDLLAGPSEVVVLADDTARPAYVAADLLAQAEHDPMSSSLLVTPSRTLADSVAREVDLQLASLPRSNIAAAAIGDFGLAVITADLQEAVRVVNELAPEHLEILAGPARVLAADIIHAGAIFIGPSTPEPVGDYLAGPSHVLPTGGTARFYSGLSVNDFLKRTTVLEYSEAALAAERDALCRFARAEGLEAHARSVEIRKSS